MDENIEATQTAATFDNEGNCPICLLPQVNPSIPPCRHVFCYDCLVQWCEHSSFEGNFSCPMCKAVFNSFVHSDGKKFRVPTDLPELSWGRVVRRRHRRHRHRRRRRRNALLYARPEADE